jgi:hypothetical protein
LKIPADISSQFLDLGAGDDHCLNGVRVEVEVGHVLDGYVAGGHVGVIVRTAAAAGLEGAAAENTGRSSHSVSESMSVTYQVWAWLTICTDGIVCDKGEIGMKRRRRLAHRSTYIG